MLSSTNTRDHRRIESVERKKFVSENETYESTNIFILLILLIYMCICVCQSRNEVFDGRGVSFIKRRKKEVRGIKEKV